jgi:hypothetical protein
MLPLDVVVSAQLSNGNNVFFSAASSKQVKVKAVVPDAAQPARD